MIPYKEWGGGVYKAKARTKLLCKKKPLEAV